MSPSEPLSTPADPQHPAASGGSSLDEALERELAEWNEAGLRRRLEEPIPAAAACDFVSNDYLGFSQHPDVIEAARAALTDFGAGGRAARLLGGGCPLHERAESRAAEWLGAAAGLLFPSGYQANVGLLTALAGAGDAIISDEACHASLIDACRLSRARTLVHGHLDLEHTGQQLAAASGARRRLLITEGVFSMDGDGPDLLALAELAEEHDAWLIVDEAHSAVVVGPEGRGAWAAACAAAGGRDVARLESRLAARVVTGGKGLGVAGAFVVGSAALREHLVNRARPFVFTTAVPPPVAGALLAAIDLTRSADELRRAACGRATQLAASIGLPAPAAAIVPLIVGDTERTLRLALRLSALGLVVRAVRPPTVPDGTSRLRLAFHSYNSDKCVAALSFTLQEELRRRLGEACKPSLKGPAHAARRPATRVAERSTPRAERRPHAVSPQLTLVLAIVGTDTGVGKTVVSALLARASAGAGGRTAPRSGPVVYWKPVQTGEESDTDTVLRLSHGLGVQCEAPALCFPLPASPHEAAAAAGGAIDVGLLRRRYSTLRTQAAGGTLIIEPAGGLLVPLDALHTQADLLASERPGVVVVARSGLGTLNHTLLTLEALESRGLRPLALFLVGEPHRSNRDTLAARSSVPAVYELPPLEPLTPRTLDGWLERYSLAPVFGEA